MPKRTTTAAQRRSWSCLYCGYCYVGPATNGRAYCSTACVEAMKRWVKLAPRLPDGGLPQVIADIRMLELMDRAVHNGGANLPDRYPTLSQITADQRAESRPEAAAAGPQGGLDAAAPF